ncbi:MAG: hypothetical protein R3D00_23350 [Bacteroidia bacterium]
MKTHYCRGIIAALYVLLACTFQSVRGQENYMPDMIPPSPTAAALGKYGEVPVSHYTGIPKVNIPLWEIHARDLNLDISLSYHAGGVKVEEIASWTGLGWSLNAGGVITRTVRGLPDELPNGCFNHVIPAANSIDEQADYNYLYAVSEGTIDAQPDLYYYNFAGRSGKFLFEENGDIFPVPYEHIKIERISAYKFQITDENGIRYIFGTSLAGEEAYEVTSAVGHNNIAAPFVSSWYLTDILSPSGKETITMKYSSAGGHLTQPVSAEVKYQPLPNNLFCQVPPAPVFTNIAAVMDKAMKLTEINWPNGKIVFVKDGTRNDLGTANLDYKLTSMVIYNRNNQEVRRINLAYSYFNNSASDYKKKRLKLISITEKAPNGDTKPPYLFSYEESVALPSRTSKQQDHWGFYNGMTFNDNINSLIPTVTIGTQTYAGANRTPNFNFAKAGVLTKITFPTGGYSKFEYELNTIGGGGEASGLRVKKTTTHDGIDPAKDMVRTLVYEDPANPGISSGKLVRPLSPYYESLTFIIDDPSTTLPGKTIDCIFFKLSSFSTIALGRTQGGTVGYTHVTELLGVNGSNGKSELEFSFIADYDINSTMDWHRGKLLKKTDYARTQTGYRKVKQVINTFSFSGSIFLEHDIVALHVKPQKLGISPFIGPGINYLGLFDFWESATQSRWVIPTSTIERIYNDDGVDFSEKKVEYEYDNYRHGQVTRTITTNSDGRVMVNKQKYAMDYDPNLSLGIASNSPKVKDFLDKFMRSVLIEVQSWEGPSLNNLSLISGNLREFAEVSGSSNIANKLILPIAVWNFESVLPVSSSTFTPEESLGTFPQVYGKLIPGYQVAGKNWYKKIVQYQYDTFGNVIQQQKIFGNPVSIIWGYNNQIAIAQVNNATANEVAFSSFEDVHSGNWAYTGTTVNTSAKTGERCYALSSGNIMKANIPAGNYLLSYWAKGTVNTSTGTATANSGMDTDNNGWTYIEKKISFSGNSTLTISGSGQIDELRLHPEDATMTTTTYDSNLQLKGMCDTRNIKTSYEYDLMGRLRLTRDHESNILQKTTYNFKN